ncbi:MAG TPA: transcription elongation factor GreA [Marmoricola sp.]|nr:transcription elongation factor GreA [Marmoricola sp.]
MTASSDQPTGIWLTQARFDELTAELEHLRGEGRAAIVKRVSDARDEGDLKENAGYHAAREELGKLDGRIAQLANMLEKAQVGEAPVDASGAIAVGMMVTYRFVGDDEDETVLLGAREMAGDNVAFVSPQSPLGAAMDGATVGDTVSYEAPNGKQLEVEIVRAEPYTG